MLDAFKSALLAVAEELGKITHDGQQIVAKISELSKQNTFFVEAECGTKSGFSDRFSDTSASIADADDGRQLAYKLVMALKQAAHNANPKRTTCDEIIASNLADAIAKHDPTFIKP